MYYVCSGNGIFHTNNTTTPLTAGDIFFSFPGNAFEIESKDDFKYMYISFVGIRGNMILEHLNISKTNFLFHNAEAIYDLWKNGLSLSRTMTNLATEAVLLYTFAHLGNQLLPENTSKEFRHSVTVIKKYIDENYTDHDFSVEQMGKALAYNSKYISSIFKKHFGIGIVDYLNTIRIQTACDMMQQHFTSVSDVSDKCGYSDVHYFSKIFKKKMGVSPTQYINELKRKN